MDPIRIWRCVEGKRLCFTLTDEELDDISSAIREQDRVEHLIDQLCCLDEDDSCFHGCDRDELIENPVFLREVMNRWYHLDGHGGDSMENLRTATEESVQARLGSDRDSRKKTENKEE